MIIWCMLIVLQNHMLNETAVKGKVMSTNERFYLVDFSEYAKKQGYEELTNPRMVEKYKCMEDKK